MKHAFVWIKNEILSILFPTFCLQCGKEGVFLCISCRDGLSTIPPKCIRCSILRPMGHRVPSGRTCSGCQKESHIYAFISPFRYSTPLIRELLHRLKYNSVRSLAPVVASLVNTYIEQQGIAFPSGAVLVPIPLFSRRERTRGFNQSECIARGVAERFSLPLHTLLLKRIKKAPPQVTLSAEKRRKNVENVFEVEKSYGSLEGAVVLLLDDVKTTGATLEEAARTLKEAGVKQVWAITVAH